MLEQLRALDATAERLPKLWLESATADPAVSALIRQVAGDASVQHLLSALGNPPVRKVGGGNHPQPGERAVSHRDVDELALAGVLALGERGEDAEGGHQASPAEVGDLSRGAHRWSVSRAGEAEQSVQRQVVGVVARAGHVGPVEAVAGDRAVDDPGVDLAQSLIPDSEAVEDARPKALEDDVGAFGELQKGLATVFGLEIDPN
jgi:hypothetical protein